MVSPETAPRDGKGTDRRQCKACRRKCTLNDLPLKNGRRRRVCWTCQWVRRFRQQEVEHRDKVRACLRQLIGLAGQERLNSSKTQEVYEELIGLCGNAETAAKEWRAQYEEARKQPERLKLSGHWALAIGLTALVGGVRRE
jgi:hypothetical protein